MLPTFTTIIGQGGGRAVLSIGEYDPAMLVHGEQSIRLHGEIPPAGTVSTVTTVAGIYDKGSAGLVVLESESRHAGSGELAFSVAPPSSSAAPVASAGRAIPRATGDRARRRAPPGP